MGKIADRALAQVVLHPLQNGVANVGRVYKESELTYTLVVWEEFSQYSIHNQPCMYIKIQFLDNTDKLWWTTKFHLNFKKQVSVDRVEGFGEINESNNVHVSALLSSFPCKLSECQNAVDCTCTRTIARL